MPAIGAVRDRVPTSKNSPSSNALVVASPLPHSNEEAGMQGYIARKRDRWYAVIYEGVDPETGRERRRWVPAGTDRSDAEALAIRLGVVEAERRNGFRSELTVDGFVTRYWLPAKQLRLEPTSFDGYRRSVRLHIHPHLGGIPLRKLQTEQIEQLYTELLATGNTRTGEALSAKTVLEVHVILRAALGDAVRRGFLRSNPAIAAHAPRARRSASRAERVWTADQLGSFLQLTTANRRASVRLILLRLVGPRRGGSAPGIGIGHARR